MEEELDLDADLRRWIDDVHARLGMLSYYALLGVVRNAGPETLKSAYFRITSLVHPDKHYGKRLGSYRAKMEAILLRATQAYEALSDPIRRAQYDASLPAPTLGTSMPTPIDPKTAAQREAARAGLERSLAGGKAKLERLLDEARRARAAGDAVAAAEKYAEAAKLAPEDELLQEALRETQREASAKLAESHKKKALVEERFGNWSAAATSWQRVLAARPDDEEARTKLAQALARAARGG
jgi:hypothetical protein